MHKLANAVSKRNKIKKRINACPTIKVGRNIVSNKYNALKNTILTISFFGKLVLLNAPIFFENKSLKSLYTTQRNI